MLKYIKVNMHFNYSCQSATEEYKFIIPIFDEEWQMTAFQVKHG